jgi:hypothetical protein
MTIRKWRPEGTKTKDDTSDEEVARRSKKRGKPAKEFRKRVRCCYESANNAESDRNRTRFSIHLRFGLDEAALSPCVFQDQLPFARAFCLCAPRSTLFGPCGNDSSATIIGVWGRAGLSDRATC